MFPNRQIALGGLLETTHRGRPPKYLHVKIPTKGVDQIPCLLQQGEVVIPKRYVPRVAKMLKKANIHLPRM